MRYGAMTLALLFAAGCASAPAPQAQMSEARASIRAASELKADEYASSSLYLKMANDELERAEAFIAEEEMKPARRALERAEIDAELALELARAQEAEKEAREALRRVQELRRQSMRQS